MHEELIISIIKNINCKSYLELGLGIGETINKVSDYVSTCIGVDINEIKIKGTLYKGTTDDFFEHNKNIKMTFDVIFIDANHKIDFVIRDLENSIKILNENGVIILHDTDPDRVELLNDCACSDSYKIIDYVLNKHNELNIVTLPFLHTGISILNRKNDRRTLKY